MEAWTGDAQRKQASYVGEDHQIQWFEPFFVGHNSSFMQFWGISHHIPCLDTHFEASRIVLYTCKNEDVSNRNESFEERTSGWWCNNHLEKWWSSSVGMMTFHSQLFLESHSKFHGSSHHQPDIGLCPTGQWRLDGHLDIFSRGFSVHHRFCGADGHLVPFEKGAQKRFRRCFSGQHTLLIWQPSYSDTVGI